MQALSLELYIGWYIQGWSLTPSLNLSLHISHYDANRVLKVKNCKLIFTELVNVSFQSVKQIIGEQLCIHQCITKKNDMGILYYEIVLAPHGVVKISTRNDVCITEY